MKKIVKTVKTSRMAGAEKLRIGEVVRIADATGYSASHVSNVIAGRRADVTGKITKAVKEKTRRRK